MFVDDPRHGGQPGSSTTRHNYAAPAGCVWQRIDVKGQTLYSLELHIITQCSLENIAPFNLCNLFVQCPEKKMAYPTQIPVGMLCVASFQKPQVNQKFSEGNIYKVRDTDI